MPTDLTGTPTSLGIGTYNVDADAPSGLGFNEAMAQIDALMVTEQTARAAKADKPGATGAVLWNGTTWVSPSGTPDGTKFLRDDGSWEAVPTPTDTGKQLDYAQITANTTSATTTSPGTTLITGNPVTYDGTKVKVNFFGVLNASAALQATLLLIRDTTLLGRFIQGLPSSGAAGRVPVNVSIFDTPSAGSHTYKVAAYVSTSTLTVIAGVGGGDVDGPAYLLVTKA